MGEYMKKKSGGIKGRWKASWERVLRADGRRGAMVMNGAA
jgi:hypothetical protein